MQAASEVLSAAGVGEGDRVCVALSGGVDSVVLLHVLFHLRSTFGYALSAAHVHHGLSPHADAWQAFCESSCASLEISCETFAVTIDRHDSAGLEAAARQARHAALNSLEVEWLTLGHHRDDQAETVLFRLLRGAGVRGAAAMRSHDPGRHGTPGRIRPFLGVPRAEILGFARASGLSWVEDESNTDPRFSRNVLRHRIMPAIDEVFPGAGRTLARAADNFREAEALLGALAEIDRARCGGDVLDYRALMGLDDARLANVLRHGIAHLGSQAPSRSRLTEVVRQLRETNGRSLSASIGAVICRVYRGRLSLERIDSAVLVPSSWSGQRCLSWGSGRVHFEPAVGAGVSLALLQAAEKVELLRPWAGLGLCLAPGRPRQSFRKICQTLAIPTWTRARLPVLCADGQALWIAQLGVSADHQCPPGEPGVMPRWDP